MADISYTPHFHHTDWVDNVDRVQAGGPNGFNARFTAIEGDLTGVSTVVTQINTALAQLGAHPPAQQQRLTLAPALVALQGVGSWGYDSSGIAVKPQGAGSVAGMMSLTLPDKVRMLSLRAVGQNISSSALVRISLFRAPLLGVNTVPDRLARVSGDGNPYDNTAAADPNFARVDLSTFRYYLIATVDNAGAGDVVTFSAVQLTYIAD